jgi:hypothetical protein
VHAFGLFDAEAHGRKRETLLRDCIEPGRAVVQRTANKLVVSHDKARRKLSGQGLALGMAKQPVGWVSIVRMCPTIDIMREMTTIVRLWPVGNAS